MAVSGLFSDGVWMKPALAIWTNRHPETPLTGQQAANLVIVHSQLKPKADLHICSTHLKLRFDNETPQLFSNQTTRNFSYSSSVPGDSPPEEDENNQLFPEF